MKELSLYIHIPFCEKRCRYCDFATFTAQDHMIESYVDALIEEIKIYSLEAKDYRLKSIFFGGGTPSHIEANHIVRIMDSIRENFNLNSNMEITMEANPGSLNRDKIRLYKQAGINRYSLGAQSFNNEILKNIGRNHRAEDIEGSVKLLQDEGIYNISLDLIFNLPNQKIEDSSRAIERALELGVRHLSHYGLIIEETTSIYKDYISGKFKPLEAKEDRELYHKCRKILEDNGFNHYEISNFALAGYESIHNLAYWKLGEYIGLGLSASSNFKNYRFTNSRHLIRYIENLKAGRLAVEEREFIDSNMEEKEFIIMGIRKIKGIDIDELEKRFKVDFQEKYAAVLKKNTLSGLIEIDQGFLKLTKKGMDLCNQVELDFFMVD